MRLDKLHDPKTLNTWHLSMYLADLYKAYPNRQKLAEYAAGFLDYVETVESQKHIEISNRLNVAMTLLDLQEDAQKWHGAALQSINSNVKLAEPYSLNKVFLCFKRHSIQSQRLLDAAIERIQDYLEAIDDPTNDKRYYHLEELLEKTTLYAQEYGVPQVLIDRLVDLLWQSKQFADAAGKSLLVLHDDDQYLAQELVVLSTSNAFFAKRSSARLYHEPIRSYLIVMDIKKVLHADYYNKKIDLAEYKPNWAPENFWTSHAVNYLLPQGEPKIIIEWLWGHIKDLDPDTPKAILIRFLQRFVAQAQQEQEELKKEKDYQPLNHEEAAWDYAILASTYSRLNCEAEALENLHHLNQVYASKPASIPKPLAQWMKEDLYLKRFIHTNLF